MSYCVARDHAIIVASSGPGKPKYAPVSRTGTSRVTCDTTSSLPSSDMPPAMADRARSATVFRTPDMSACWINARMIPLSR